jgi:outer membrane biosynthesis protein TonB
MYFRRLSLALLTLLLAVSPLFGQAQKNAGTWTEWETITPEGEEFTIMMPKNPTTETTKFPYHKMELNTRLYLARSAAGPVLAVASFSGIKSSPMYTEFARFNSYIDAFKDFFPPKVRSKDTVIAKLTLLNSKPFNGHTGRSYKITVGELSGVVQAYVTRKRFYAIVSLNTKKDEALEEKFLSSFVLPERQPDAAKTAAANQANQQQNQVPEQVLPEGDPKPGSSEAQGAAGNTEEKPNTDPNAAATVVTQNPDPNASQQNQAQNAKNANAKRGPISGGVLNGKAIYFPQPEAPAGEANGVVSVQVLIDEQGSVIDAKAVSGPQHLHQAAVNAARLARFTPTLLMGEPVKVTGVLAYNFARSN